MAAAPYSAFDVAPRSGMCSLAMISSAFNLTLSAIGAGILSFPYAFSQSGLAVSLVLNVFMALLNSLAVYVLFTFTAHAFRSGARAQVPAAGSPGTALDEVLLRRGDDVGDGVGNDTDSGNGANRGSQSSNGDADGADDEVAGEGRREDADGSTSASAGGGPNGGANGPHDDEGEEEDDGAYVELGPARGERAGLPGAAAAPFTTYEEVIRHFLGRWAYLVATSFMLFNTFGALLGYLMIVGDVGSPVAELVFGPGHWYSSREALILVFAWAVAFPLSTLRSLRELTLSSIVAVLSVLLITVGLTVRGSELVAALGRVPEHVRLSGTALDAFVTLPIFMFGYGCQLSVVPVYAELPKDLQRRTGEIVAWCMGTCLVAYSLTGTFGYFLFRRPEGDILRNYSDMRDSLMAVAAGFMALHVILAYPVVLFPARRAARHYVFLPALDRVRRLRARLAGGDPAGVVPSDPRVRDTFGVHTAQTAILVALTSSLACLVPQVSEVFGLCGGLSATTLSVTFPMLLLASRHGFGEGPAGAGDVGDGGEPSEAVELRRAGSFSASPMKPSQHVRAWNRCASHRRSMLVLSWVGVAAGVSFSILSTVMTLQRA